jgi:Serine/threonine protein kinase
MHRDSSIREKEDEKEKVNAAGGRDDGFSLQPPTLQGKRHPQSSVPEDKTRREELQRQEFQSAAMDDSTRLFMSRKRPSSRDFVDRNTLSCPDDDHNLSMNDDDDDNSNDIENVVKIRRLNLNDTCDDNITDIDKDSERNNGSVSVLRDNNNVGATNVDNAAVSPIVHSSHTAGPKTHHTVMRKTCYNPSNSFYISPNDVMMDPYHNHVISKRCDDMITKDVFGTPSFDSKGDNYHRDVRNNENDALNSTVDTLDISIPSSQPPSPTLFDFESDFFSPPAAPVKKAPSTTHTSSSTTKDKLCCNSEHGRHEEPPNDSGALPLEYFYNRIGKGSKTGGGRRNDWDSPMHPPQTPMTQRKPPSGRRFPLFQLSPHKQKRTPDFHASIFGESPMPSSYSQPASTSLNHGHGKSRHVHDVSCCVEPSRLSQDFQIIGTLGDGSFGTVYKCLSRLDGCTYAIKASKRRAKGRSDRERMLQEVKALAVLSDVSDVAAFHIVRYHQAWIEDDRLHIVTDLCTSTLHAEMARGLLKDDTQRQYKLLREMLLALKLIHQHGKVHLDIKPDNIFVKDDIFKLGDFGLAVEETTVGEVEEGDCRYMCRDLMSGNHRDLTKVGADDVFVRICVYI